MNTLEKHFKIRERGSSVRTEVLAGMTTLPPWPTSLSCSL